MRFKCIATAIVLCAVSLTFAAQVPLSDVQKRKDNKNAISLFQPWATISGGIIDTANLHPYQKIAIHDLVHNSPEFFALKWDYVVDTFPGNAESFTPASIAAGTERRNKLLALNPNIILIGEVRFYDAPPSYLPDNSPYWMRDSRGAYVPSSYMDYRKLDLNSTLFQTHVANQCKAMLETGVVDGIFLDWAKNDRAAFFRKIREFVGDDALLIGNVNQRYDIIDQILPLFNGVYMESGWWVASSQTDYYVRLRKTISMAQAACREPKLICTEVWSENNLPNLDSSSGVMKIAQGQMRHMRAGLATLYTHCAGYYSFYPQTYRDIYLVEHMHIYDDFFNASLGKPIAGNPTRQDSAYLKDWENGTVVFNPPNGRPTTVTFTEARRSQKTGVIATQHTLPPFDGDIFLKGPYTQLYPARAGFLSSGLPAILTHPDTTYKDQFVGAAPAKSRVLPKTKALKITTIVKNQQVIIQKAEEGAATKYYNTAGRQIKVQKLPKK